MNHDRCSSGPTRLAQATPELTELFTDAERAYRRELDEVRAWEALQLRLAMPGSSSLRARRKHTATWFACAAAAVAVLTWFGWHRYRGADAARAEAARLRPASSAIMSHVSIRLAPGKSQLADGTMVELTDDAQGTLVADAQRATLQFDRGRLDIHVAHQPPGHTFAVKAHDVEFVVLGTRFSVVAQGPKIDLSVTEGKVLVNHSATAPIIVQAGGHWSNLDLPSVSSAPKPSARNVAPSPAAASEPLSIAKPSDISVCRDQLRGGKPQQAQDCYLQVAAGSGLSAEMALYEVARLRRDVLSNPASSLAALDDYEARFPAGTLRPEVQQARVDLLSRLGRVDEALRVSAQLLASSVGRSRATELRLLRGNLLRDKKHDCTGAIAEYRQIESDPGARGDHASFGVANCLERLGRSSEAIDAYRRYLQRPQPAQADQARRRLSELAP